MASPTYYNPGDTVFLREPRYFGCRTRPHPYTGPFRIHTRYGRGRVGIKSGSKYAVVNLSELMKKDKLTMPEPSTVPNKELNLPPGQYEVDSILRRRRGAGDRWFYKVRFTGYGPEDDLWLPASEIDTGEVRKFLSS
jgi:hypothetical protein